MGAMCVLASDGFFRRVPRLIAHGVGSYQEAEPLAAGNHFLARWFFWAASPAAQSPLCNITPHDPKKTHQTARS
jgi:hypothetical protein